MKSVLQRCSYSRSIACQISPFRPIRNSGGSYFFKQLYSKLDDGTRQSLFVGTSQVSFIRLYHRLLVRDIPFDATEESVCQHFSQYGMVLAVKLMRNPQTIESKGCGHVVFADKKTLDKVVSSRPHIIGNQRVHLNPYEEISFLITDLSSSSTQQSLKSYFVRFGNISSCAIKRDLRKGSISGFVNFADKNEMNECLASSVHTIDGKQVKVKLLMPKELMLYVGNLSPTTTDQSLNEFYSRFGTMLGAEVKRDRLTGVSRCFGYVCFSSQTGLDNALTSMPHIIDGSKVNINYSTKEFTLFFAGLSPNMSEDHLRKHFEQFGPVYVCVIARDKQTNQLLYHGWVTFSSKEGFDKALEARPHVVNGEQISVDKSNKSTMGLSTLFVGGLSTRTTDQMLHDVFSKFGSLVSTEVKLDRTTRQSRGFGFVEYSSPNEVSKALLGGPHEVDGRVLKVRPRNQSDNL